MASSSSSSAQGIEIFIKNSAFKKRIRSYTYKNIDYIDLTPFLEECKRIFIVKTREVLQELSNLKSNLILEVQFIRPKSDDGGGSSGGGNDSTNEQISTFYLQSAMKEITPTTQLNHWFNKRYKCHNGKG